ncbi:hypothetical protein QNI19_30150 [Cytophagaceae bacterium DM2B3-1]|uniref:Uncharacterized protein n=1 Tax=Xanthocytophaga flava TaxID=3048013 RepID=A0ABT7CU04_9BACT|nr:hypothetical protein [Xanthocytophaga flavus]MDJ1497239.1 hypothetical protein [Xanthocytophaga flavus]
MKDLLLENLKNAIFLQNPSKDWDFIKSSLEVVSTQSYSGGAIFLYKNENDPVRYILKDHGTVYAPIADYMRTNKFNKAHFTLYPDGRYESEFIWDQQAHIDFLLLDMATAFSFIYSESDIKITDIKITDLMIPEQEWEKAVITILFVNGHILPLQIEVTTEQGIKQFSVPVQNLSYQEAPYLIKSFEDIYQLANEGELKQHFAPGWNTVIIYQDRQDRFNFEEHVHFELRDLS